MSREAQLDVLRKCEESQHGEPNVDEVGTKQFEKGTCLCYQGEPHHGKVVADKSNFRSSDIEKRNQMFTEQIEKLKEEEKCLLQVNKRLREQYLIERGRYLSDEDLEVVREKKEEEVETELFIGRR
ncbi:hypothetical protein V8G54_014821 [Vigna mungo]|uniref:Uncharacterized protein n=1 Tax=Vigna mungo TaxID=3915 RepID=A0AAQ3RZL0_VIGMU